jgi:hypothetical protein
MLIFDNQGAGGKSRVLEFSPFTQQIFWTYDGREHGGLHSSANGSVQRLPNGNTLVVESDNGRAIEVNPGKEIVWEFYNPQRAGENDELVATLFDMIRLAPDFPVDWADSR